jgi:chromosome partitioning protein
LPPPQTWQNALVIDVDPQATASQWSAWRNGLRPRSSTAPPRIAAKVEAAKAQGATFIVVDTPPHADTAATRAVEVADLVLIPCRPSAFDLAAIRTTIQLVRLLGKPAFVVFTAGPPMPPKCRRLPS